MSRRMLTQILGVVVASSMFVLAMYLVGVLGNAQSGDSTSTTVAVAQMPPTVPSDATVSAGTETSPSDPSSTATTATTDEDAAATAAGADGTQPDPTASPTDPPAATPRIVEVSASDVRDGSADSCGTPTSYEPDLAADQDPETAWMAPGDGVGAVLAIELAEPSIVSQVGLVPGYDKLDPCSGTDRFDELRRVTAVRWTFDDGTSVDQELDPTRTLQTTSIDRPVVTSRISMTIVSTTEPGVDRLDHTPVSEVVVS